MDEASEWNNSGYKMKWILTTLCMLLMALIQNYV